MCCQNCFYPSGGWSFSRVVSITIFSCPSFYWLPARFSYHPPTFVHPPRFVHICISFWKRLAWRPLRAVLKQQQRPQLCKKVQRLLSLLRHNWVRTLTPFSGGRFVMVCDVCLGHSIPPNEFQTHLIHVFVELWTVLCAIVPCKQHEGPWERCQLSNSGPSCRRNSEGCCSFWGVIGPLFPWLISMG